MRSILFVPGDSERKLAKAAGAGADALALDLEDSVSGAGTISLDGKMYDIPHLRAAERLLKLGSD
jgi:citrate lyase beta subunit